MACALIVAIESYPRNREGPRVLCGTNRGAALFREWLIHRKGLSPSAIVACAGDASFATHGTTRADVRAAVDRLRSRALDDELFVFISGLGFRPKDASDVDPVELVATSDLGAAPFAEATIALAELRASLDEVAPRQLWFLDCEARAAVIDASSSDGVTAEVRTICTRTQAPWTRIVSSFARVALSRVGRDAVPRARIETHRYVTFDVLASVMRSSAQDDEALVLEVHPLASHGFEVESDPGEGFRAVGYELFVPSRRRIAPVVSAKPIGRRFGSSSKEPA